MSDTDTVTSIKKYYESFINDTPTILSLLYDADLLPEQVVSLRSAISMAAVVEAYKAGKEDDKV